MTLVAHTVNRFGAMLRLLVGATLLLLVFVTSGYATGSSYSDMWAEQNGDGSVTVWGLGVSDDTPMHGYEHLVEVATTLTGPNGNYDDVLSSYGYIDALVELPAVVGDYQLSSFHSLWCGGSFSSSKSGGIAITIRSLERQYFLSSSLAHYKPCNTGGICRNEINISTSQSGGAGTLTLYVYVDYLSFSAFGLRVCFVSDVDPTEAVTCPPDPLP